MTRERTIADLDEDLQDLSLVGDTLRDATWQTQLDLGRLEELQVSLAGCAPRSRSVAGVVSGVADALRRPGRS